jgi:uncharacterized protein
MTDVRDDRQALFGFLESASTQERFFARVADDVDWSVLGTHPLAGRYRGKEAFVTSTFARLHGVLPGGVELSVSRVYVDGDTTIAELIATSRTNEGASFDNHYCWVCRFEDEMIVEVRAYLDSMMVAYTILRNEARPG